MMAVVGLLEKEGTLKLASALSPHVMPTPVRMQ